MDFNGLEILTDKELVNVKHVNIMSHVKVTAFTHGIFLQNGPEFVLENRILANRAEVLKQRKK